MLKRWKQTLYIKYTPLSIVSRHLLPVVAARDAKVNIFYVVSCSFDLVFCTVVGSPAQPCTVRPLALGLALASVSLVV